MSESTIEWLIGTFIAVITSVATATAWIMSRINAVEARSIKRNDEAENRSIDRDKANRDYCESLYTQINAMKDDNEEKFVRHNRFSEAKEDIDRRFTEVKSDILRQIGTMTSDFKEGQRELKDLVVAALRSGGHK